MDLSPPTTNTPTTKSPEPESDTPSRIQPAPKPISFTNGVLKRHNPTPHHHHYHHHHPLHSLPVVIAYKECLKNHAATLGGHALDGCGEFMPSPSANSADPTSLKCAACGCHRNFHRREPEDPPPATAAATTATIEYQPHHRHHPPPPPPPHRSPNSASPPPISSSYYPSAPHMLLALSGGLSAPPENINTNSNLSPSIMGNPSSNARKRFRTKFSQNQKEKMHQFAERVGWKMQKRDEELVHQFCNEIGVERNVLKVWMHNNKNTFGKRDLNGNRNSLDSIDDNNNNGSNNNGQNLNHLENDSVAHVGTNGSSSSS